MTRIMPKPAVSGGLGRIRTAVPVTLLLLGIACTGPGVTRGVRGALPPARPGAPVPRATRARLALPARVAVELTSVARAPEVAIVDSTGTFRRVTAAGDAVRLDAEPPREEVIVRGPVRIGEALHRGDVRVTGGARGELRTIIEIGLEDYVASVVAAELPIWSAEPAELEAQAIAARTFAVTALRARRAAGADLVLTDGVLDQAYCGAYEGTSSAGAARAQRRLEAAVRATRGLVLMRGDSLEEARYHASCGRHTANFADVFADEVRELGAVGPTGVHCRPCATRAAAEQANGAPDATRPLGWIARLEPGDLERAGAALGLDGPVTLLAPARVDDAGRWLEVHVAGPDRALRVEPFDDLRAAIGYGVLKGSAIVTTLPRPGRPIGAEGLTVQGRGRGHGVGLCQEALRDLAREGWSAARILRHYYPGTRLERLPVARD